MMLGIMACANTRSTTPTTGTATVTTAPVTTDDTEAKLRDQNWISPAKVEIGNYYPGGRAEYNIRVHLGAHTSNKAWKVTTDPGETKVVFQLTDALYQGSLSNVVTLTSDLAGEKLTTVSYNSDTRELAIGGFQPQATRTLNLSYYSPATMQISYRVPDHPLEGYTTAPDAAIGWVIIADPAPVLQPWETKEIQVALAMPKDASTDLKKWEFWISMIVVSGDTIQTEVAVRWLVTMK